MPFIADDAHLFHCDEPLADGLVQEQYLSTDPRLRKDKLRSYTESKELHRGHTEIHGEKIGERVFSDSFSQQMGTGESDQIFSIISVNLSVFSV